MAEINTLEYKFSKNCNTAFEDMVTLMFCADLGLTAGVNRRINQKGIESDPVRVGDRVYAYQAKYYAGTTDLRSRKNAIIKSIQDARAIGVTDLYFFVNKDLPDLDSNGLESSFKREIDRAARGTAREAEVELHWWTLSKIETSLDMPKFKFIRDIYFNPADPSQIGYGAFYEYIVRLFTGDRGKRLFGDLPLADSYIEPSAAVDKDIVPVRSCLESLVLADEPITVMAGEPGHGKTSLCRKAVYDYYKKGWLLGKVSNVFCFSLNPARTNALANGDFDLYALLSWGENRRATGHGVEEGDCENALIFLDGFDELLEWCPGFSLKSFLENEIIPFQAATGARVVITCRNMAVERDLDNYELSAGRVVPVRRLQPITKDQQLDWIRHYIEHEEKAAPDNAVQLKDYLAKFMALPEDEELEKLLGVPIIFRMIVSAGYLPEEGMSLTGIFDDLFHVTYQRHRRKNSAADGEALLRKRLQQHALEIYLGDNETAEVDSVSRSAWVFSFYTTDEGKKRIGFLHRSFYQYFLAREIISWYEDYAEGRKAEGFIGMLACLSRRQLEKSTLNYIREMSAGKADGLREGFAKAQAFLKETDGIIPLEACKYADSLGQLSPLERGNNCFWNMVSIGSICGYALTSESFNDIALSLYVMSECDLSNAVLEKINIDRAYMQWANLSRASLDSAIIDQSDFSGATLVRAKLRNANVFETDFHFAFSEDADFTSCHFYSVDLEGASLNNALLVNASLELSNFDNASMQSVDLTHARILGGSFKSANLCDAVFREANIKGTSFTIADLTRTDFSGAELTNVDLRNAILTDAIFNNTTFVNVKTDKENAEFLKSQGYDISKMIVE